MASDSSATGTCGELFLMNGDCKRATVPFMNAAAGDPSGRTAITSATAANGRRSAIERADIKRSQTLSSWCRSSRSVVSRCGLQMQRPAMSANEERLAQERRGIFRSLQGVRGQGEKQGNRNFDKTSEQDPRTQRQVTENQMTLPGGFCHKQPKVLVYKR